MTIRSSTGVASSRRRGWRWRPRVEPGPISFALIDVAADTGTASVVDPAGRMEIELPSGARVRVGDDVSEPALVRVLSALKVAL